VATLAQNHGFDGFTAVLLSVAAMLLAGAAAFAALPSVRAHPN